MVHRAAHISLPELGADGKLASWHRAGDFTNTECLCFFYEDKCEHLLTVRLEARWKAVGCPLGMLSHSAGHLAGGRIQEDKVHSRYNGCGVVS